MPWLATMGAIPRDGDSLNKGLTLSALFSPQTREINPETSRGASSLEALDRVVPLFTFTMTSPVANLPCERLPSGAADERECMGFLEAIATDLNPRGPVLSGTLATNNNRPTDEVAINILRISA